MTDLSSPNIMFPCSSCAVPKEEYQESILQQLMSEVELEFSALDQEIHQHGLAPALGEAAAGPGRARAPARHLGYNQQGSRVDPIIIGAIHFESLISVLVIHI